MRPVQKLAYKIHPKRTIGRHIELLVDGEPLLDLLENSIPPESGEEHWREKRDTKVVRDELITSFKNPGEYGILTCAHYEMVEDTSSKKIKVTHKEDTVPWTVKSPGSDFHYTNNETMDFKFH
ncbi:MAG: hypothetical protein AAF363_19285 [Bacteroidota bacterium]